MGSSKRKLKVAVVELLAHSVTTPFVRARVIAPETASVMPQAIAAWCEELGHDVHYDVWTSREDLTRMLPDDVDVVFISAFTRAAYVAYALSHHLRARGTLTVLGGPHAMSFAEHARDHFDVVCKTTDRALIEDILRELPHAGGVRESADGPATLPGVAQRARFIDVCLAKGTRRVRVVPMLGSFGCPYTCAFCVDASAPYRPLDAQPLVEELRFIERTWGKHTLVGWHDPNFGVRFDDYLGAIEASRTDLVHCGHMSLSLLGERNLARLEAAHFGLLAPGVESWFEFSDKTGRASSSGREKVAHVAATLNRTTARVHHVQTNVICGLDSDAGDEPFALTRELVERAPAIYPTFFLVTNFYNAPLSKTLHDSGRTLAVPFPLLDTNGFGNVLPLNYRVVELYDRLIELYEHAFSWRAIGERVRRSKSAWGCIGNGARSVDEGRAFIEHHTRTRARLERDRELRAFYEGERVAPPSSFMREVRAQLGRYADLLPDALLSPQPFAESFAQSATASIASLRAPVAGIVPLTRTIRASAHSDQSRRAS